MTEKEFLELFEEVIEAEPGTLSMDKWVVDIGGWNSIAIMSFIAMVDEKYEVILSPGRDREFGDDSGFIQASL